MGDLCAADMELLSDLADRHGDGALNLSRDQNVVFRSIPVSAVVDIRKTLLDRGLYFVGEAHVPSIRACTGSAVCALGITKAPDAGVALLANPALGRNSSLRVHVSGCPNSCAQHQVGDIGLAGSKVRVGDRTTDGYHVFLGADLDAHRVGEVVGRVAAEDVPAVTEAICGIWESVRRNGETLGQTVLRVGHDAFAAHLEAMLRGRWSSGPEEAADVNAASIARASRPVATAADDEYVAVARADTVPPGSAVTVMVGDQPVALANAGGTFCAVADTCPHAGGSLGRGAVDGWSVSCPLHGATFDLRSGEALGGPADAPVPVHPVRVEDGEVRVAGRPAVPASVG
jgi:nitrite reductase/ring-hydroxylating ferredoxin subunit/dissimilatory sulfite reductase (desulfoviridin) alpha/beta subunit